MTHLYTIGTLVTCEVDVGHKAAKPLAFTVEAQMPPVGNSLQYRIKSEAETFRRVVAEHQISALTSASG